MRLVKEKHQTTKAEQPQIHIAKIKVYSKPVSRLPKLHVILFLFSGINAAVAPANLVFTGEHFQSVPMTGERDYTQTNELQYIMSYWRNCTSSYCLLFDERMSAPILTSCETSCDTAPAMSMETNNLALLWTQAMKVHIFDIQGCCRQEIFFFFPPSPLAPVAGLH